MENKTIIVTGGSRGLGAATARIAAQMGANVVLAARSEAALQAVAGEIQQAGGQAVTVAGDLRQPAVCRRVVETAMQQFGGLDGLVNNAGIVGPMAAIANAEPAAWTENWEINVLSPVVLTQMALPYLRDRAGCVVHISTGMAVRPVVGTAAYNMAKAALNMFNATLALEETAITTLALRPGGVDTQMQVVIRAEGGAVMDPEIYQKYATRELLPPEVPGRAAATLVLHAPHTWSGKFISYDDADVQALVEQYEGES